MVGQVQKGRLELESVDAWNLWTKATVSERRQMVIGNVRQDEETDWCMKVTSQKKTKQGWWMSWESVERRKISWCDLSAKWKPAK